MVKYSYKEKKYHFNALRNADSASVDLELLLKLCPEHPDKRRFTLYSNKLGDEILLSLLDFATKEEIREFRRKRTEQVQEPKLRPEQHLEVPSPELEQQSEFPSEGETGTDDSEQRVADAEQRAVEAEERADDAEQRAEEAEDRAEQAEQALEEEKKKGRRIPVKSKKKKSSPK